MRITLMVIWSILCISTSLIILVLTFSRKMPLVMARTIWAPGILWLAKAKRALNKSQESIELFEKILKLEPSWKKDYIDPYYKDGKLIK